MFKKLAVYLINDFRRKMKSRRGTWVAAAVAVVGAGTAAYSSYSSSKAASKDKLDPGNVPNWWEDPNYKASQDVLAPFGKNLLEGKLPDFYSSLGKTGTPEFTDMLKLISRDTASAINENMVRRNISRGGVGASLLATTMADTSTKLRWEDLLKANTEKQNLMTTGTNVLSGVRGASLDMTGQQNQFDFNQMTALNDIMKYNAPANAAKDTMWANILSSAIGSGVSGYKMGAGADLGSADPSTSKSLYDKTQGTNIKFGNSRYNM